MRWKHLLYDFHPSTISFFPKASKKPFSFSWVLYRKYVGATFAAELPVGVCGVPKVK
jgi:hypothetical protein